MAFEKILNGLLQYSGVEAVIFLDSEGEAVFCFGDLESDHLKAMGAYQGIVLSSAVRLDSTSTETVITRCQSRSILTRKLKDGYFVCVVLSADANFSYANFAFRDYFNQLIMEL